MTKADIVSEISNSTGTEKLVVQSIIEAFMESIKSSMIKDKNIYFRGFGSFVVKKRAKKIGRNISKKTSVIIPEHFVPTFKPAKEFKIGMKSNKTKK